MPLFSSGSTKSIQKQYVDKRIRQIHRSKDDERYALAQFAVMELQKKQGGGEPFDRVYQKICDNIRQRDLTINFCAWSWFANVNDYDTYKQMYERGATPQGVVIKGDVNNPPVARAIVDDLVTLPADWASAHPWTERRRLHDALSATGANQKKVKNPTQEKYGPHIKKNGSGDDDDVSITLTSKAFKPQAKQIFAAINYGRRPNGSTVQYGYSYLKLLPALGERAIYYGGDTFSTWDRGTDQQATWHTIGAILASCARRKPDGSMSLSNEKLLNDLWASCYHDRVLPNTTKPEYLVEAHLFMKLKVAEHVSRLYLSREPTGDAAKMSDKDWATVMSNAATWCKKNKVGFTLIN